DGLRARSAPAITTPDPGRLDYAGTGATGRRAGTTMNTTRTPSSNAHVATALPRKAGIGLMACLAAAALLPAAPASAGEALLETVRRAASAQAGQPVQLVPETVNLAGDWALVFGGVSGEDGTAPDWSRARDAACHEDLDKALWAIARHGPAGW